jgi:hypothetical protein
VVKIVFVNLKSSYGGLMSSTRITITNPVPPTCPNAQPAYLCLGTHRIPLSRGGDSCEGCPHRSYAPGVINFPRCGRRSGPVVVEVFHD